MREVAATQNMTELNGWAEALFQTLSKMLGIDSAMAVVIWLVKRMSELLAGKDEASFARRNDGRT